MSDRPFHHGNLRAVLLERAEVMLRAGGVDALSLRELARQAGVSHGAPRSHFIDRQALLDALAVRGFERLTSGIRAATDGGGALVERFRRVARSYVGFAVEDEALMELMFATKGAGESGPVREAAVGLFQVLDEAFDDGPEPPGADVAEARQRMKLLFAATMQGIAALLAAHRVTSTEADQIIEDAVDEMLASSLGRRARASAGSDGPEAQRLPGGGRSALRD